MKIGFLISSLAPGGAERVAAILCNTWARQGHDVVLLALQGPEQPCHYRLAPDVEFRPLDLLSPSTSLLSTVAKNLARIRCLRRELRRVRPDILVCFMTETNVLGILAARGLSIPIIISERVHPGFHELPAFHRLSRKLVYRLADQLVVQTAEIAAWCSENLSLKRPPAVIPNPLDQGQLQADADTFAPNRSDSPSKKLVSVGRLEPQKGMGHLIRVFQRLAERHGDWSLDIYGEGSLRPSLEAQIDRAGLTGRVRLMGLTDDIGTVYRAADIFALASRYEGFPNTLAEALGSGLCCIAADAPGAARELLSDGAFGVLAKVDDVEDWVFKLDELMTDGQRRRSFAEKAVEAVAHLDPARIAALWLEQIGHGVDGAENAECAA